MLLSSVMMLSVILLNVILLNVIMLNVIMLSVIILNVMMLKVAAPFTEFDGEDDRVENPGGDLSRSPAELLTNLTGSEVEVGAGLELDPLEGRFRFVPQRPGPVAQPMKRSGVNVIKLYCSYFTSLRNKLEHLTLAHFSCSV
jgi:hypothetical protein